jgi:hypothetical protein
MEENPISKLKKICMQIDEKEPDMDKNFWAVNMHGDERMDEFIVPDGVRIIMFCYSGRKLDVCPRFDRFNWREIFLNEEASFNYCTFLSNISQYSSLRDHFCVYEKGTSIKDLDFSTDEYFRNGIFRLPVHASVFDPEMEEVYVSSSEIFDQVISKIGKVRRILVDKSKVANLVKDKDTDAIIFPLILTFPKSHFLNLLKNLKFLNQKVLRFFY